VKVFGSQMTKILTPSSDLDIAILNVPEESGNAIDLLYELEKEIRAKGKKIRKGGKEKK
jgi:DNA polymerase sigma